MNEGRPGGRSPPIVNERDNGLEYLRALCELFDAPFDKISDEKRSEALQLFTGLYIFPAIENGDDRIQALDDMDEYCNQHFPLPKSQGVLDALKYGLQSGLALSWGTTSPDVRIAYNTTRAEMIVYRAKWRNLTTGNPDDLITGYRWRRIVTGLFEVVAGIVGAGVTMGSVDGVLSKSAEGYLKSGTLREAARQGGARLAAGGSGIIEAATQGRGVRALATRGGVQGLLATYIIGYTYATLKDEEQDLRNAVVLRVLNEEIPEAYMDDINGPIDVLGDIYVEWWEKP